MGYRAFKDSPGRTALDKILWDKAFNIAKNPKYDRYHQRGLASTAYKCFDKKSLASDTSGSAIEIKIISNQELAQKLHKSIIRKFEERKVYASFIDNIWGADLIDMQLTSKFNKDFQCLWCIIHIYSKYAWVVPLKDEKDITITNAFQKFVDESNRKLIETWVDKGSEFLIDQWNNDMR